ncbi:MAG TPA: EAL domain-containing protein [Thermoanaerobaculia bacterium]|nr:EAL domain-containing protein [Thermoanaerobaculia bacterium]
MKIDGALVALTAFLTQALCAALIAAVLMAFHRIYRRRYLQHWERSWWAFCVYLLGGTLGVFFYLRGAAPLQLRLPIAAIAMAGGFWQLAWLLFGVREVTTGRRMVRRAERRILAGLALAGVAVVVSSLAVAPELRVHLRIGVRVLTAGSVFLLSGWLLLRTSQQPMGLGRKLLGASFLLYGAQQVHYLALFGAEVILDRSFDYPLLLGMADVLLQTAMGMGMVIWLLEEERKRVLVASEQIEHLAYHDTLTGLPNRSLFLDHVQVTLVRAERDGQSAALLFIDLDRFKSINDSLGHSSGDEVLKIVAERLRGALRQGDTVARLAGDEFTVLLPGASNEQDLVRVAGKLLEALRHPIPFQGRRIVITASLGISRFPDHGTDAEDLLRKADLAMYQAKRSGRDGFRIYAPALDAHARERASLESDLRRAVDRGEMVLFYQPIFQCGSQAGSETAGLRIVGVETLLRWQHPGRGLLGASEFLSLADQSGMSQELDLWVLRTACEEVAGWNAEGARVRLAVNLSARPYRHAELAELVGRVLKESGLPPEGLELEITETLAMQNAEASLGVLRKLKELGVQVSIDDFGTGYSSLSYLHDFPIDTLKIDDSFVRLLGTGESGAGIPASMITLARGLNVRVVAEGVETNEQLAILRELGCDELQGYLLSPPLPAQECRRVVLETVQAELVG